jgi:hypothetical protein
VTSVVKKEKRALTLETASFAAKVPL